MKQILRLATRKSPLALWQANFVAQLLKQHWPKLTVELVPLVTSGDRFLKTTLLSQGGKGLFVKELEEALLDKRADAAVHSMKDVPSDLPEGLIMSTLCQRDTPLDALISPNRQTLQQLPPNAVIGTSSLRRQAQVLALRSDLQILPLRGNIHTRLKKLDDNQFDAIILAAAALKRMDLSSLVSEEFEPTQMLPACGQGALGIECRAADEATQSLLSPLHDANTSLCVSTERRVNALLGGNCHVPLAVYAHLSPEERTTSQKLILETKVMSCDGRTILRDKRQGPKEQAETLADLAVTALLAQGASALLEQP